MSPRRFFILASGLIRSPIQSSHAIAATRGFLPLTMKDHIRLAADWLLTAQRNCPDGDGFARRFSLAAGWDRGYVETTGYIVPTLFDAADYLDDDTLRQSAIKAGEWLLTAQTKDGAFAEIDHNQPMVFDTGQVMLGLNRLWLETEDSRYLEAAKRAGAWLCEVQDADGAWRRHAYKGEPHSYYSRVGAALAETGQLIQNSKFIDYGRRNLNWVLAQELPNGWFEHCGFRSGEPALLHTIVYVLEGLLMGGLALGKSYYTDAAIRGARTILRSYNPKDLVYARYYPDWCAADREYCTTGLAQVAGICFKMERLSTGEGFIEAGEEILTRLCSWQCREGKDITGGLPSTIPLWGSYGCMAFYNWNMKFFIDAANCCFLSKPRDEL